MAILTSSIKFGLSGRLGNLVARTIKGRIILSRRPAKYTVSNSAEAVKCRKKFAVTVKLTKCILSFPDLKLIWAKLACPNQTAYSTIFKNNYDYSGEDTPSLNNKITPGGFELPVTSTAVNADRVYISISSLNKISGYQQENVNLSLNAVVCFTSPVNPADDSFLAMAFSIESVNYKLTNEGNFLFALNSDQKITASKYTKSILLLSAVFKTAEGKIITYSSTYSKEN